LHYNAVKLTNPKIRQRINYFPKYIFNVQQITTSSGNSIFLARKLIWHRIHQHTPFEVENSIGESEAPHTSPNGDWEGTTPPHTHPSPTTWLLDQLLRPRRIPAGSMPLPVTVCYYYWGP